MGNRLRTRCVRAASFLLLAGMFFWLLRSPAARPVDGDLPDKVVYLTYDDGPSPNTDRLLDVLKEEGAPATFFVIGREGETAAGLYRRILAEGHALGLHSYSHQYREIYRSVPAFLDDLQRLQSLLWEATGASPRLLRFPGGSVNRLAPSRAILDDIVTTVAEEGYCYCDWNVVSGDDTATVYPPETLAQNVLHGAKGKERVVVLFHDAPLCTTTADATRLVIRSLRAEGYRFAVLTEQTPPIHFNPAGDLDRPEPK